LGRVVERRWDLICPLHDLLNSTTLTQKIVVSLVLQKSEILTVEDHKLYNTFLHVAFGSQSLLKSTSDQTGTDTNCRARECDQVGE
jgi:hypothetical protein